jgi:hypothetical protein
MQSNVVSYDDAAESSNTYNSSSNNSRGNSASTREEPREKETGRWGDHQGRGAAASRGDEWSTGETSSSRWRGDDSAERWRQDSAGDSSSRWKDEAATTPRQPPWRDERSVDVGGRQSARDCSWMTEAKETPGPSYSGRQSARDSWMTEAKETPPGPSYGGRPSARDSWMTETKVTGPSYTPIWSAVPTRYHYFLPFHVLSSVLEPRDILIRGGVSWIRSLK